MKYGIVIREAGKRNKSKKLEELSGVKQPVIARMEKGSTSPQLDTILKVLRLWERRWWLS